MYRISRYAKKAPTSVKAPFIIFNPHSTQPCISNSDPDIIVITTIDPGIKNCAIRTSTFNIKTNISKTLLICKIDFTHVNFYEHSTGIGIETQYYAAIFSSLEPYERYFQYSHYIGIESQLAINYDLVRMGQHIITFLMCCTRNKGYNPLIIELDSHLKSRLLQAPPKMTKVQLKAWARAKGIELLRTNGENDIADFVQAQKKGDDYGDVICYEKCIIIILRGQLCAIPQITYITPKPKVKINIITKLK